MIPPIVMYFSTPKVDYGESYEPVRVMKNYSRLKGEKLREMKKSLQMCDEEAVEELSTFSISEMHESLTFLEGLFSPSWETTDTKLQRTLIVALVLHGHVKATQKNIKGTSDSPTQNPVRIFDQIQNENDIVDRAKRMVQTVCCQLGSAEKLKDATLSMDLLAAVVADCVGHCNVESLTANELYEQIFHNL